MRSEAYALSDAADASWLERVRTYYRLQNLLLLHPELPLWIVQWDGKKRLQWWELNDTRGRIQPFHFEIHFGKESQRDDHYERLMTRAADARALTVGELFGFADAFYPLPADSHGLTFLYSGQFCRSLLDVDRIGRSWTELSGQSPASTNPDFLRFVRMALKLPVLRPEALQALGEMLELYAAAFGSGMHAGGLEDRAEYVKERILRHWPDTSWVDQAIGAERLELTPWQHEGRLAEWMSREMGICRIPTTAMALMPVFGKSERVDSAEALVRAYQIQHACLDHVRGMPETGAARLQDYGVTFLTSAAPEKNPARQRLELRERALELRRVVRTRFGVDSVVGIGRSEAPGEALQASHHEAVVALHLCVQLEEKVLCYGDKYAPGGSLRYADLHDALGRLSDAFLRDSLVETKVASDHYVRLVLLYAGERIEVVRGQLLAVLFQLIDRLNKRHVLAKHIVDQFADDLSRELEAAGSLGEVIDRFKEALERLGAVSAQAVEGPKSIRLGATLQYLKQNFAEPLRLPEVAKKAGFSVPAFSRTFRQATGTSFLSYLRNLRIEHARTLLRTSTLSAVDVARACGFQSQHHLIRSFKKVTGLTPGTYRRKVEDKRSCAPPRTALENGAGSENSAAVENRAAAENRARPVN